jgi:hypothetical protein
LLFFSIVDTSSCSTPIFRSFNSQLTDEPPVLSAPSFFVSSICIGRKPCTAYAQLPRLTPPTFSRPWSRSRGTVLRKALIRAAKTS